MKQLLLDRAVDVLGWPGREDVFRPSGAAKKVLAEAADRKIGDPVRRFEEAAGAQVGILTIRPASDTTESPLALVCEFPRPVGKSVLREAQRLAWNFSLSPQIITIEPHLIRSFTCCEQTAGVQDPSAYEVVSIAEETLSLSEQASRALHWVSLLTGEFFQNHRRRFLRDRRADHQLLSDMRFVRKKLLSGDHALDENLCHDLLARVIFIQFLIDRKDPRGNSPLNSSKLQELVGCSSFGEVLRDGDRAYELFKYLNQRFNGDLFAGNGSSDADRSLLHEKSRVGQPHLDLLAKLVEGNLDMKTGQMCLWKQYAFDVIPLEFISSIYEEFVSNRSRQEGAYYTPQHLVDFVLDGVLPWDSEFWDLKIMDPACGSGVFLVKAFQRLVHRWRAAHHWRRPSPEVLRQLLQQNIFGVDSNLQAVRVSSFSLYLAMCDHLDSTDLWRRTSFPRLRGTRVVCSDFFAEDVPGVRTLEDADSYDLIIGNPPWGQKSITPAAEEWSKGSGWSPARKDIGPLFLPKCLELTKPGGTLSMLQPAMALLFNRSRPAREFRSRLFARFKVEEVTNLAAVRFAHFVSSDSPVCIITMRPIPPDGEPLTYICPKPTKSFHDTDLLIIEPQDVNTVFPSEGANEPHIWTALMWGGRRDWELIQEVSRGLKFKILKNCDAIIPRLGIMGGKDLVDHPDILGRRILTSDDQIEGSFLRLQADKLGKITDARSRRRTDLEAFEIPQLVLKRSWLAGEERFRAFLVDPDELGQGILTTDAFISIHAPLDQRATLEAACLTYNSAFAVYYLLLTSGRFASERPALLVQEALNVPIPDTSVGPMSKLGDPRAVDLTIRNAFGFSDLQWALIQDLVTCTVPYFKSGEPLPARQTHRVQTRKSELETYSDYFLRVLQAGFGDERPVTCVAFVERESQPRLPIRLLAIYLNSPWEVKYKTEEINGAQLYKLLAQLHKRLMARGSPNSGGVVFQRIARIYDVADIHDRKIPTVYMIKPDEVRCWTKSMALRDADEVTADIMSWASNDSSTFRNKEVSVGTTAHPF